MVPSLDEHARTLFILRELAAVGRVEVKDLAERCRVSTVTVRKDLETLERRSALRRVHGGAVAAAAVDEGPFEVRMAVSVAQKTAIARAVAPLVRDGDVIAMDSSTTSHHLAVELLGRRSLVVVTNSLRTATLLSERSDATVVLTGGTVRRSARSVVGMVGDVLAGRGQISRGFVGGHALSAEHGLMDLAVEEAQAKRYLTAACAEVHGLVDASKLDGFSLHTAVPVASLTDVWTDTAADPVAVAALRDAGLQVRLVGPGDGA